MKKRIIFDILLLGAVFYAPWWVVVIFAFVGAFMWPPYYEVIAFGVLLDLLYGSHVLALGGMLGLFVAVAILLVAAHVRKAVR